jgi:Leucine-rich repeat (LRR) protein
MPYYNYIMDLATLIKCATNGRYKNLVLDKRDPTKALSQITYLSLDNRGIQVIENLEMCSALSVLYLSENQIGTLKGAFVKGNFRNLVQLSIDDNEIQRIEGLESLVNLKKLYIEKNNISRLEGLSKCTRLEELYLSK